MFGRLSFKSSPLRYEFLEQLLLDAGPRLPARPEPRRSRCERPEEVAKRALESS